MYLNMIIFFFVGLLLSIFLNNIWYRLPIKKNILNKSKCDYCNHELDYTEKIPIFSFIIQKGKCNYCKQKISFLYLMFEVMMATSFSLIYMTYSTFNNSFAYIIFAIVFVTSLLLIMFTDIKYMLIPNELLIVSSVLVVILKLFLGFASEELNGFIDAGYMILFMAIDAFIMFVIMYIIKKIGDLIFKKESLGGGDVKMMAFIAIIMGYKMSIIIIFLGSFIALPFSIYNAYKKNEVMLPFGPFLALATIVLFLLNINFDTLLNLIN